VTDPEFLAMLIDKGGLPGAIIAALLWAMWRFGLKPSPVPVANETAAAINALAGKVDKVGEQVSKMDGRLIRVETKLEDRH